MSKLDIAPIFDASPDRGRFKCQTSLGRRGDEAATALLSIPKAPTHNSSWTICLDIIPSGFMAWLPERNYKGLAPQTSGLVPWALSLRLNLFIPFQVYTPHIGLCLLSLCGSVRGGGEGRGKCTGKGRQVELWRLLNQGWCSRRLFT